MTFINIKYPLQDDVESNFLFKRNKTTQEGIKSNLYFLLTTEKGSRFFNREYGSNLRKYLFEPSDSITDYDIEQDIKNTVSKYMPKLKTNTIQFQKDENNENSITVFIHYTFSDGFYTFNDAIAITF